MSKAVTVAFHGVRGSRPVSDKAFQSYGGATSCISVRHGDEIVVLDLGTAAPSLGRQIGETAPGPLAVLVGHAHYDHVAGLPFFLPFRSGAGAVTLASAVEGSTRSMIDGLMARPFFPVGAEVLSPALNCRDIRPGKRFFATPSIEVEPVATHHPGGCVAYRLDVDGYSILYALDHQVGDAVTDERLADAGRDVDLAILDAGEPIGSRQSGTGHSTWQEAVGLGRRMRAGRIALAHHAPVSDDLTLDRLARHLADRHCDAVLAREGHEMKFEAVRGSEIARGDCHAGL
jgi:phosphoribosyl 1,2-cyclic phosphodiesterase